MTDEIHACHCAHVVVIQTKVTIAQWFIAALLVAVLGVGGTMVGQLFHLRISSDPPPPNASEKLFLDRVGH